MSIILNTMTLLFIKILSGFNGGKMDIIIGYKVVGERQDGSYIEGDVFTKEYDAHYELSKLSIEFPTNEYWVEYEWGEH